ncbi:hypothetical protein ACE1TH_18170 [Shouchella sp. JSM 1781072]|nr:MULTISPECIES: hypothetical protein [Bacillaceae]UTR07681.1 hypothetical protein MM326_06520 [Alkalihalobacillus sp. LMS6]
MDQFDLQIPTLSWMFHPITLVISILFIVTIVIGILKLVKHFDEKQS